MYDFIYQKQKRSLATFWDVALEVIKKDNSYGYYEDNHDSLSEAHTHIWVYLIPCLSFLLIF